MASKYDNNSLSNDAQLALSQSKQIHRGSPVKQVWNIRGAIALALFAVVLPACSPNDASAGGPSAESNVTTEEVANRTNELIGKTVTVRSEVAAVGTNTFTVSDEQFLSGETILVVNQTGKPFTVPADNTEVQVTGEVRKFIVADLEREFDLDLEPNLYVEYENKPAIIARSIALAPKPGEVTANPSQYYGKTLAVPGEVEDIISSNAFKLDEDKLIGGNNLLVLVETPQKAVKEGEKVVTTGVLRPFVVADIERDYDLTWDLDLQRQLEAEYQNKPVLIAESVYPTAVPQATK